MKVPSLSMALLRSIALACAILSACKIPTISIQFMEPSATLTSTPTDTPTPQSTQTPIPTSTSIPTPTVTSTYTLPPSATKVPITETPSLAIVEVTNNLTMPLRVTLRGPTPKTFTINAKSSKVFEIEPGFYEYTLEATGFRPLNGTNIFESGYNTWTIGKEEPL